MTIKNMGANIHQEMELNMHKNNNAYRNKIMKKTHLLKIKQNLTKKCNQ
jgi:hypothetical protein